MTSPQGTIPAYVPWRQSSRGVLKDELIHAIENADDKLIRAEDESDEELASLKARYEELCDQYATLQAQLRPKHQRSAELQSSPSA